MTLLDMETKFADFCIKFLNLYVTIMEDTKSFEYHFSSDINKELISYLVFLLFFP